MYRFQASDPEGDTLVFELGPIRDVTGAANITEDGVFSFTPCADCHGTFNLQITGESLSKFHLKLKKQVNAGVMLSGCISCLPLLSLVPYYSKAWVGLIFNPILMVKAP